MFFVQACIRIISLTAFCVSLFLYCPSQVFAASKFSVSSYTGFYSPHLDFLNKMIGNNGIAILQDANYLLPRNEEFLTEARNMEMEPFRGKVMYGVEAEWRMSERYTLYTDISSWEGTTAGEDMVAMFTRSNLPSTPVPRESRYIILVNNISVGWKYNLYTKADDRDIYLNFGMVGLSNVNFTMDALIKVVTPDLSFASMSSMEAKGRALFMKFGGGGNYFITNWLSFGANVNYLVSNLVKLKVSRRFVAGYPFIPTPPPESDPPIEIPIPQIPPGIGDSVSVSVVESEGVYERMVQDPIVMQFQMDGFEFLFSLNLHF